MGEAGCRGSGWRTVWVRLAAVGQADVLGMRMPAGSLEKRSGLMQNSSSESQLLCYSNETRSSKGYLLRTRSETKTSRPRDSLARDLLVRDSSCQLRFVRTFPKPGFDHLKTRNPLRSVSALCILSYVSPCLPLVKNNGMFVCGAIRCSLPPQGTSHPGWLVHTAG